MENRNLTIVFTKGGINELRKQLDAVSTYCFNNDLFIEKIIFIRKSGIKEVRYGTQQSIWKLSKS